jgi:membrane protease YdiL (CAAX protease family)
MKNKNTSAFIATTLIVSWLVILLYYLSGGTWHSRGATIIATSYMFIPLIVTFIFVKREQIKNIKSHLGISFKINKWFIIPWLLMPIMAFLTFGITLLFPGIEFSPEMKGIIERYEDVLSEEQINQMKHSAEMLPVHPVWLTLLQGLLAGATINAVAGFGEELGWRGYLFRKFENYTFIKAAIIIGLIWGIWHAPIILMGHNYPEHPVIGAFMMTIWCIMLTPLFLYFRIKSRSVIQSAIMHGTINATYGLSIMLIKGGNDLTTGMTGIPGFITLLLIILLVYFYDTRISKEKIMEGRLSVIHNS